MCTNHINFKSKCGRTLHAVEMGSGGTYIFLIHGLINNWEVWQEIAQLDDKNTYTFVAIDLLGYGHSDRNDNYSFDLQADVVLELIEKYFEQKGLSTAENTVYIGGLSMGSLVTAHIASKKPDYIDGYILMGPVFHDEKKKYLKKIMKYLMKYSRYSPISLRAMDMIMKTRWTSYVLSYLNMYKFNKELVDRYGVEGKKMVDVNAYISHGIEITDYDTLSSLLERPQEKKVLLILGKYDTYASVDKISSGEMFRNAPLDNYEVVLVDRAGHPVSYENPHGTFAAIQTFVNGNL